MILRTVITIVAVVLILALVTTITIRILHADSELVAEYEQALLPVYGTILVSDSAPARVGLTMLDEHQLSEMAAAENIQRIALLGPDGEHEVSDWILAMPSMDVATTDYYQRSLSLDVDSIPVTEMEFDTLVVEFVTDITKEFPLGSVVVRHVDDHAHMTDIVWWVQSSIPFRSDSVQPGLSPVVGMYFYLSVAGDLEQHPQARIIDIDTGCPMFKVDPEYFLVLTDKTSEQVLRYVQPLFGSDAEVCSELEPFRTHGTVRADADIDIPLQFAGEHQLNTFVLVHMAYQGNRNTPVGRYLFAPVLTIEADGEVFTLSAQHPFNVQGNIDRPDYRAFLREHGI